MTTTLQKVIEIGKQKIEVIPYNDGWGEFDSPDDLNYYS